MKTKHQAGMVMKEGRKEFMIIKVNAKSLKVRQIFRKRSGKNTISMTFGDFFKIEK